MPELPEVETVCRGLAPSVTGRRIERIVVREPRLRWPVPADLPAFLSGRTISAVERRGKYLVFRLDTGGLLMHLGMSGRLRLLSRTAPVIRHDHLDLILADNVLMRFHDPRRFGCVLPLRPGHPEHALLANLGPEPFDDAFNGSYLHARASGRTTAVKNLLMDSRVVAGIGNIYASEVLFAAGVRPDRPAADVGRPTYGRIAGAVRSTLARAIASGGTTIRDFSGALGEAGYFQQVLMVYGREGGHCRCCGALIRRCVIGQRSSFFCPKCQR